MYKRERKGYGQVAVVSSPLVFYEKKFLGPLCPVS